MTPAHSLQNTVRRRLTLAANNWKDRGFKPFETPGRWRADDRRRAFAMSWCLWIYALVCVSTALGTSSARAAPYEPAPNAPAPLAVPKPAIVRHELDNGLKVVLNEDHSSPTVAICMTYDVGGRNEEFERSGFAHLFEHLMFQGSRNVEKGQHFGLIASRGGTANGTTNKDRTNYFEVLPAHELELGLWLEADRLQGLALNRENFKNQRAVVLEEYRRNYSGRVYGLGSTRLHQLVFQNYWPYEHPVIGFIEDLERAEYEWARDFHQTYYRASNAVLSVSGDFSPDVALQLIEKHFGDLQKLPPPPQLAPPRRMPYQSSERLSVLVDEAAKTPGVFYGWRVAEGRSRDQRIAKVVAAILDAGDSSALTQKLVFDKAVATRTSAWASSYRGPNLLQVFIEVTASSSVDAAQMWLDGELKRLRVVGPTAAELDKAKAYLRLQAVKTLQTNRDRAIRLGEFETFWSDAELFAEEVHAFDDVTIAEIKAFASKRLVDTQRSVVEIYPPGWVRDIGPPVITRTHIVKKGETLIGIANKYGTTAADLAKHNGISSSTHVRIGQRLLVTVKAGYGKSSKLKAYTIKKGDTLTSIAKRYRVTPKQIADANNTTLKRALIPGQTLAIPPPSPKAKGGEPSDEPKLRTHTVKQGDTLLGIALKYGVSLSALAKQNGIPTNKRLSLGQELRIPPGPAKSNDGAKGAKSKAAPKKKPERTYTVKKGDTLSGIANRYGLSSKDIARRNGLNVKKSIRPGQKLIIPNKD